MTQVDQNPAPPSQTGHEMPAPLPQPSAPRPRRRRFRIRLTREKVVEFLKTMAWVIPLTILIWVYAEREQIVPGTATDIPVRISTSDSNLFVEQSAGGAPPQVNLKLSGPEEGIEKAQRELTSGITPGLQVDLGKTLQPSDQPQRINVVNRIQGAAVFRDNGVSVLESTPAELEVTVDEVKERTVDIQLPSGLPNVDATATTIEPRTTLIRGPARLLNAVSVSADLAKVAVALQPGVHTLNDVPLQLTGAADRITIVGPAKATVRLVIQSADETFTLPNPVPVVELITPTLQQGYDIKLDPLSLTDVKVVGPPDKIKKLRDEESQSGGSPVRAVLDLSTDDIGKGPKAVTYTLPEGIRISPDSPDKTVSFTLTPRGG